MLVPDWLAMKILALAAAEGPAHWILSLELREEPFDSLAVYQTSKEAPGWSASDLVVDWSTSSMLIGEELHGWLVCHVTLVPLVYWQVSS